MGRDEKEYLQFADPPRTVLGRQLALLRVPLRLGRSHRGHASIAAHHPTGSTAPPHLPRIRLLFRPGSAHASHPVTRRIHHPWFCQQRPSPSSARQNQQSALALPQKAPPPRPSSQDPAILSVSPEPLRPNCDHPRLQTPRLGDHTGACCVCPPLNLKILPKKNEISRGRDYSAETGTAMAGSALARNALFLTFLVTPNANDSPIEPASNARMTYVPSMLAMFR